MNPSPANSESQTVSKAPVFVVVLAGIALVLLLIVVGGQYQQVKRTHGNWSSLTSARTGMLLLSSVFGLAAAATGLFVIRRVRVYEAWGMVGVGIGVLPITVFAGLFLHGLTVKTLMVQKQVQRAQSFANIDQILGQPIPAGPEVFTWEKEKPVYLGWYHRHWLQGYQSVGKKNPRWDLTVDRLLNGVIHRQMQDTVALDNKELFDIASTIMGNGCDDPLALYAAGVTQLEYSEKRRVSELARKGFAQSNYSPFVQWMGEVTAMSFVAGRSPQPPEFFEADARALKLFEAAVTGNDFLENEFYLLKYFLQGGAGGQWRNRHKEEVCQMLEKSPNCPEWLAELFRGMYYIDEAWRIRGNGFAKTVTPQGWEGFRQNMELAKKKLTRSWELNPQDPTAASEMIRVMMGNADNPLPEMRLWFDRAVAARFDFYPAYDNMLWALRPRWHGTHEAMIKFGQTCLQTARFDTAIPRYYFTALSQVADDGEGLAVYTKAGVNARLRIMYSAYAEQSKTPEGRRWELSNQFVTTYMARKYDHCVKDLEQLGYDPDPAVMVYWHGNHELLPGAMKAWNGPGKDTLLSAAEARRSGRFDEALAAYRKLGEDNLDDPFLQTWSEELVEVISFEQALSKGDWVPLPLKTNLAGWRAYRGDWKANPDGSVEGRSKVNGMMLKFLARPGMDFAFRGEMEFLSSTSGDFQSGVAIGALHPDDGEWISIRARHTGKEGDEAMLSRLFGTTAKRQKLPLGRTNTFEVTLSQKTVSAKINGAVLVDGMSLLQVRTHFHKDLAIGLAAYSDQNEYAIRYRNLEVKSLSTAKAPVTDGNTRTLVDGN